MWNRCTEVIKRDIFSSCIYVFIGSETLVCCLSFLWLRLTYWLSNTVMLREIISQEFGSTNRNGSNSLEGDWTDVRTLIAALRRVESCLFTHAVESIWSQVKTKKSYGSFFLKSKLQMLNGFRFPLLLLGNDGSHETSRSRLDSG